MSIKVTRNKVPKEMAFNDIINHSRGRALIILKEVQYNNKEEEFMEYLKEVYPKGVSWKKLKELLAHKWEDVFEDIGISI